MTLDGLITLRDTVGDVGSVLAMGAVCASLAILPHGAFALAAAWAEPAGLAYLSVAASCLLFERCLKPVE